MTRTTDEVLHDAGKMSEELLFEHEAEVVKMKEFYENNREMLELVSRRENLWNEFLELEVELINIIV